MIRKILCALLVTLTTACASPPTDIKISKSADSATIQTKWNRQTVTTWEGVNITAIDGELTGVGTDNAKLHIAPGKHELDLHIKFNQGIGSGGPFYKNLKLTADLAPKVAYFLSFSIEESIISVWVEEISTGNKISPPTKINWTKESPPKPSKDEVIAAALASAKSYTRETPNYLISSRFVKRKSNAPTSGTALFVLNNNAPDRIDSVESFKLLIPALSSNEELDNPKEFNGYFSSIKDLTKPESLTVLLSSCIRSGCKETPYIEILPGTYEIDIRCFGVSGVAQFKKQITILPNKKYHAICIQPSLLRGVSRLTLAERPMIEPNQLEQYYSNFKQ
jgi:hypothetical protein